MKIYTSWRTFWLYSLCFVFAGSFLLYGFLKFSPYKNYEYFIAEPCSIATYDNESKLIEISPLKNGLRREFTPLNNIPAELVAVFVYAEDSRFFKHGGIDFKATVRAAFQNIMHGRKISGASTITMQLASLIAPSEARKKGAFFLKITELWNALRLEMRLTKNQILELYLNHLPFGFQVEGVTSAARYFFNKPLSALTREHIFCLALIPRSPRLYNPIVNAKKSAQSALSLAQRFYIEKPADPLYLADFMRVAESAKAFKYPNYVPHYMRYIHNMDSDSSGDSGANAKQQKSKGAKRQVFLDLESSLYAEYILKDNLQKNQKSRLFNGAILAIENKTGNVCVWVGGVDFFSNEYSSQIDGILNTIQPGSSMKPFLYALALENGMTAASILPDIPLRFGEKAVYLPRNFNNRYKGPVRLRTALASSLNVPAVYLLNKIGYFKYLSFLYDLQFDSLKHLQKDIGLSLALGGGEVSLLEMVRAFAIFPLDGMLPTLHHLKNTNHIKKEAAQNHVISVDTARVICSILSDKYARAEGFGFSHVFETPFPSIFKTGTANQYQNITALAASSDYTVGVWLGNFSGNTVIGKTGSSIPAHIAQQVLIHLQEKHTPAKDFKPPEFMQAHEICPFSGMARTCNCPDHITEYFPLNAPPKPCTWHQKKGEQTIVVYPPEYQEWLRITAQHKNINNSETALQIVRPVFGSEFIKENLFSGAEGIPLEVIGGKENDLQVWYDNVLYKTQKRPFFLWLPVDRGEHTITVMCGDEQVKTQFLVK